MVGSAFSSRACITVSHTLLVLLRQTYHTQVIFIPNGAEVHDGIGVASLSKFGLELDKYILNVRRIVPQKVASLDRSLQTIVD